MNTMEDKELQELFEAKRTVEANRRRQERMRQILEAEGGAQAPRKARPLWPVWAGAAAAAVALLLLTLPALLGNQESTPTLVAQTEVPEPTLTPEQPSTPIETSTPRVSRKARTTRTTSETSIPSQESTPTQEITPTLDSTPTLPIEEVIPETVAPAPRVMRRQSTLIACTEGCSAPEGTPEKPDRNVQINLFSNENYADATIYSIPIKK